MAPAACHGILVLFIFLSEFFSEGIVHRGGEREKEGRKGQEETENRKGEEKGQNMSLWWSESSQLVLCSEMRVGTAVRVLNNIIQVG